MSKEYPELLKNFLCFMINPVWRQIMSTEILTISQAAEYLQVCDKTIRRLISNKKLSASKIGGSWRIKKSDIDDYLNETKNK